jgi:hypothetical protein
VLPLLEIAVERVEGDICGGFKSAGSLARDLARLGELAARNDELLKRERAEGGADTPAGKGVRS